MDRITPIELSRFNMASSDFSRGNPLPEGGTSHVLNGRLHTRKLLTSFFSSSSLGPMYLVEGFAQPLGWVRLAYLPILGLPYLAIPPGGKCAPSPKVIWAGEPTRMSPALFRTFFVS